MIDLDALCVAPGPSVIGPISLTIENGQYAAIMGRTGVGKTTLLEAIAGLRPTLSGTIRLNGRDVTRSRPADRGVGYVPQDLALFSTMTVRQHLAFGPRVQGWRPMDIDQRVTELARLLRIEPLLNRKPHGLSGGEAQRTALGRALAVRPAVLLLDEPLTALDEQTRLEMYDVLHQAHGVSGVTTLHITHSADEANHLSDRVYHLEADGGIVEVRSSERS